MTEVGVERSRLDYRGGRKENESVFGTSTGTKEGKRVWDVDYLVVWTTKVEVYLGLRLVRGVKGTMVEPHSVVVNRTWNVVSKGLPRGRKVRMEDGRWQLYLGLLGKFCVHVS